MKEEMQQKKSSDEKIIFTREEVIHIVKPSPCWTGFDDFIFKFRKIPVFEALTTLRTCWGSKCTFITLSRRYLYKPEKEYQFESKNRIDERIKEIKDMADSFEDRKPIQITSFLHRDLKIRWSEAYPADSGIPDSAIIVEDGNHRLSALGVRCLQKQDLIYDEIDVFIGMSPHASK